MAADPIIYCLENLTDYDQFERLCSDIMAGLGYRDIEPLGGRADKGRDALFEAQGDGSVTIFAYTVREDWQRKLNQDCSRIRELGHRCHTVAFVCTASMSSSEKDKAKAQVETEYGWSLKIYDLERLRISLVGELRHLIPQHPQIFSPPWFRTRGGLSVAFGRDTVVIDHVSADHAFATWLARRLQLCGYSTWCFGTAPMGGESADETVRTLIENRAERYVPVLSPAAVDAPDFIARCSLATSHGGLAMPCGIAPRDDSRLGSKLQAIRPIDFESSWATGLAQLLDSLEAQGVQKVTGTERGNAVALRSFVPEPVTMPIEETLLSNVFPVEELPVSLVVFRGRKVQSGAVQAARESWAFAVIGSGLYASFCAAPESIRREWGLGRANQYLWSAYREIHGRSTFNVVKEVVRRSLEVACFDAGLAWCPDRELVYFPQLDKPQRRVSFVNADGNKTTVSVTGIRQWSFGPRAQKYHYQLAPQFRVGFDSDNKAWVTTRIYARVTQPDGTPFEGRTIGRRRRHLAKGWWNQHWLARTLGVMQAIASDEGKIVVGPDEQRLVISSIPLSWECPVSIDESAVERLGDFQEEMAALQYREEPDDGDEPSTAKNTVTSGD